MKKTVRIFAFAMAVVLVCMAFAACGATKLSGTYSLGGDVGGLVGSKTSLTFSGSKVTITTTASLLGSTKTYESKGAYEIQTAEDGTQSITITLEDGAEDSAKSYSGTQTFSKGEDADGNETIKVGMFTFTKTK
jgi:hypothetical protein